MIAISRPGQHAVHLSGSLQGLQVALTRNAGSVAQERLDHAGDTETRVNVDGADLAYQALPVDRSEQFALEVAGFVESVHVRRLYFDMEGETSPGCGQGRDDHEWESWPERIRWAQD